VRHGRVIVASPLAVFKFQTGGKDFKFQIEGATVLKISTRRPFDFFEIFAITRTFLTALWHVSRDVVFTTSPLPTFTAPHSSLVYYR
jgi:hypothetical protein